MKCSIRSAGLLLTVLALATPALAGGQSGAAAVPPDQYVEVEPSYEGGENYGTSTQSVYTVRGEDFLPPNTPAVTHATTNTGGIYINQTSLAQVDWWARVYVPNGSLIERVEMQACDTSATGQLLFGLARMDAPGQTGANATPVGSTGLAATPGCAFFSVSPTATLQVNNRTNSYVLFVDWAGNFTNAVKLSSFRIFYRRQVSPAPAIATFSDVPVGTPQHQFVEALVAAGITGGCGGGAYCPNDSVTRGQIAVFLAVALGLHFPN